MLRVAAILLGATIAGGSAIAQSVTPPVPATARPAPADAPWIGCDRLWTWFDSQCAGLKSAWHDGRPTLYLSGYSFHDRHTYTQEKLDEFNERAYGGGYGWGAVDANGDRFDWYGMVFRDSHFKYTWVAGWSWVTYWPSRGDAGVGFGYSAFVMTRPDIYNGIPFPAVLPVASVKAFGAEAMMTVIPKLNGGLNHGNVAYLYARYHF